MSWGTLALGLAIGVLVGVTAMALITRRCDCLPEAEWRRRD